MEPRLKVITREAMRGHSTSVLMPYSCFGFQPFPIPPKMGTAAPYFQPMSIVATQSPFSATAELCFLLLTGSTMYHKTGTQLI